MNLDKVFELYKKYGCNGYIGENITQLEHASQCAMLAEEFCFNTNNTNDIELKNNLVIAAFLHDIGHLIVYENESLPTMGSYGVMDHETIGAEYLKENGFNNSICSLVKNHIKTKRYLITKNPDYYNKLSDASKKTFEFQGGKLEDKELLEFEMDSLFLLHLKIREFDDKAKSEDIGLLTKIKEMDHLDYLKKFVTTTTTTTTTTTD